MFFKNKLLLDVLNGQSVQRPPVWLMRQAGRVLPRYRALRERIKDFKTLIQTPALACEVTLMPVDDLDVDAAIIFSDILVLPEAMGMPYQVEENKGPFFEKTISTRQDIERLQIIKTNDVSYVVEAIRLVKGELNGRIPLIGFAGAPWTIMAYLVEGKTSNNFSRAKAFLYCEPQLAHLLLQKITDSTIVYFRAQIEAGADVLQIFDSWAGILPPAQYRTFGLAYIRQICAAIQERPIIIFARGANASLKEITHLPAAAIGLDWTITPAEAVRLTEDKKVLQGNADPCLLYAEKDVIEKETLAMLKQFTPGKHIANLGHGLYPDTPFHNAKYFVDIIKSFSYQEQN